METKQTPTGSGEPQAIEQILENYFATSNEPLAVAFRTQHAKSYQKNGAESNGSSPLCNSNEVVESDGSNPLCNSNEDAEGDERNTLFKDVFPNT